MSATVVTPVLADRLQALIEEGKDIAKLHREASNRAAGCLPKIGSLLDAEDDLFEALGKLRALSPLVLVDGAADSGKSCFINALLVDAELNHRELVSSYVPPLLLPLCSAGRSRIARPLVVRAPLVEGARRCLVGRPTLQRGNRADALVEELLESEWLERSMQSSSASNARSDQARSKGSKTGGDDCTMAHHCSGDAACGAQKELEELLPLILEEPWAREAWGADLWLTEVNIRSSAPRFRWVESCSDAVCMVRVIGDESIRAEDEKRIMDHLEAGRRLMIVVGHNSDADAELINTIVQNIREVVHSAKENSSSDGNNRKVDVQAVPLFSFFCHDGRADEESIHSFKRTLVGNNAESLIQETTWTRCRGELRGFLEYASSQRLAEAKEQVARARDAFVDWCSKGTKVVVAASEGFRQDADDVRLARDLITRNIDAAYLSHVFASVLIGKFDTLCAELSRQPAPDLGNNWGRHSTRRIMEQHLKDSLETGLRLAMQGALEEVTTEMGQQELPALKEIQRITRRATPGGVPWDAEIRQLECDLRPDQLQHFALHFFGSVSVGVLSGLGAAALETLLGELVLGPLGIVAGVATFVAIGVQTADWPSVREEFVKNVRSKQLELVEKARVQLDFPGLCERRKRKILEQMDVILQRLLREVATLSEAASEFARCALVLQKTSRAG